MPNHWHLIFKLLTDLELSEFMHLLTLTHTKRWHAYYETVGTGPIYQGRYKSFPVENGEHFLKVARYVERNALRANLVERAQDWSWSSLNMRANPSAFPSVRLFEWPQAVPENWVELVNRPDSKSELNALRRSVNKGTPFGEERWQLETANRLKLESSLRNPGRPRKA